MAIIELASRILTAARSGLKAWQDGSRAVDHEYDVHPMYMRYWYRDGRTLCVTVAEDSPQSKLWVAIAVESAARGGGDLVGRVERVFEDHSHHTVGAYGELLEALRAGANYGLEWEMGLHGAPQCGCGPIEPGDYVTIGELDKLEAAMLPVRPPRSVHPFVPGEQEIDDEDEEEDEPEVLPEPDTDTMRPSFWHRHQDPTD